MEFKDRTNEAEAFFNLLKNIKENGQNKNNVEINSYNICLNARWGDGKSTFINNFLVPKIKIKELYNADDIILISAWNYDYLDDPIELIFDILSKNENMKEKVIGVFKELAKSFFIDSPLLPKFLKLPIKNWQKINNNKKNKFSNVLKMNELVEAIEKVFNSAKKDNSKSESIYKYLIIIEDLDRCKPEFAKKLFEIIKHVFNSKLFIVIFVCDWNLINSMMTTHHIPDGYNELYLERIIDDVFDLEKIDMETYFYDKYMQEINDDIKTESISIGSKEISHSQYFHNIVDYLTIREQENAYKNISKIFIRQKNDLLKKRGKQGVKYDVYPELYRFLLRKFLGKKNDDNNIFEDFFEKKIYFIGNESALLEEQNVNENKRKKEIREIIIKAILSTLYIIEIGEYKYHKKELYLKEIINIDSFAVKPGSELYEWFKNNQNFTLIKFYSDHDPLDKNFIINKYSKDILNGLKKNDILERIYGWFELEYKRC